VAPWNDGTAPTKIDRAKGLGADSVSAKFAAFEPPEHRVVHSVVATDWFGVALAESREEQVGAKNTQHVRYRLAEWITD